MSIIRARASKVDLGYTVIEGLQLPDGSYEIAVPQLLSVFPDFNTSKNLVSRDIKRLMGEGFNTSKRKTEFRKNYTNTITIKQLVQIAKTLYKKHDLSSAEALLDAALEEALDRRFDEAFAVKVTEEERGERFTNRFNQVVDYLEGDREDVKIIEEQQKFLGTEDSWG